MPGDTHPETRQKETKAVNTLRKVKGESMISGGTKDFIHFLLDYNIVSFTVAFIIARAAYDTISKGVKGGIQFIFRSLGTRMRDIGEFWSSLVILVCVLILCFLFIKVIFQPMIASKDLTEERRLREIVKTAEEKKLEKEVNHTMGSGSMLSFLDGSSNEMF